MAISGRPRLYVLAPGEDGDWQSPAHHAPLHADRVVLSDDPVGMGVMTAALLIRRDRHPDAAALLRRLADREDLPAVDEAGLWQLAEMSLEARDGDLAVVFLDHLAAALGRRGDRPWLLRVYRKMTILAPHRRDIRDQLLHLQATGTTG